MTARLLEKEKVEQVRVTWTWNKEIQTGNRKTDWRKSQNWWRKTKDRSWKWENQARKRAHCTEDQKTPKWDGWTATVGTVLWALSFCTFLPLSKIIFIWYWLALNGIPQKLLKLGEHIAWIKDECSMILLRAIFLWYPMKLGHSILWSLSIFGIHVFQYRNQQMRSAFHSISQFWHNFHYTA